MRLTALLFALALLPHRFRSACTCSPWSGNSAGDCCDGKNHSQCGSWFHHTLEWYYASLNDPDILFLK